jgi:hypothetical protein
MKHLVDNEPAKRRPKNEASTRGASLHGKRKHVHESIAVRVLVDRRQASLQGQEIFMAPGGIS